MTATPTTKLEQAKRLLREWLARDPLPASEIEARAKEAGIGWRTMEDAKNELDIFSKRQDDQWYWLPPLAPPPASTSIDQDREPADERATLDAERSSIEGEIQQLEARLPDLALDDPAAFHEAHQRLDHLRGEAARLSYAIAGHAQRQEQARRQREMEEHERLQGELDDLNITGNKIVAALREVLERAGTLRLELLENERQRQRLARSLNQRLPRRAAQIVEGLAYERLGIGSAAHRGLPDRMYPEQEDSNG